MHGLRVCVCVIASCVCVSECVCVCRMGQIECVRDLRLGRRLQHCHGIFAER
jgi:hypothetical protein